VGQDAEFQTAHLGNELLELLNLFAGHLALLVAEAVDETADLGCIGLGIELLNALAERLGVVERDVAVVFAFGRRPFVGGLLQGFFPGLFLDLGLVLAARRQDDLDAVAAYRPHRDVVLVAWIEPFLKRLGQVLGLGILLNALLAVEVHLVD